jgi:diaminohydroxyphosphoribosylaminopyrimidine deaminase/5-amino-6-(5-phosphoribosylamino)uracil reductase
VPVLITANATDLDVNDIDYELHMRRALSLAGNVLTTTPNPRVGCVIVNALGEVVGEGWHQFPGGAHAEVNAITKAGELTKKALAFVSLEPCAHQGKTPPCANALINAGISKVFVASLDPDPRVAGKGVAILEAAGIEVVHLKDFEQRASAINPGYMKRMTTGLPYVRCKLAMSVDGRTAAANRESKWITGSEARAEVQQLRAESCAVITGINTILQDDPALTVRHDELALSKIEKEHNQFVLARQPMRIILDSSLRTPLEAKIIHQGGEIKIITRSSNNEVKNFPVNTEVITLEESDQSERANGRVDLGSVLELLASRFMVNEVLIEAGPALSGAFVRAGLVDELVVYIGAKLLGSNGLPLMELPGLESMSDQIMLEIQDVKKIGMDCRITARINKPRD